MRISKRRGLYRVNRGIALDIGRAHLSFLIRPGAREWSWSPERDYSGLRTMRLRRLWILHAWK